MSTINTPDREYDLPESPRHLDCGTFSYGPIETPAMETNDLPIYELPAHQIELIELPSREGQVFLGISEEDVVATNERLPILDDLSEFFGLDPESKSLRAQEGE